MGLSALPLFSACVEGRCGAEDGIISGTGGVLLRFGAIKARCADALTDGEVRLRLRPPSKPVLVAVLFEAAVEA